MAKNNFRIDILGTSLVIAADDDLSYLQNLMASYAIAVENTRKMTGLSDNLKLAVVTGFLLCDEIQKMQTKKQKEIVSSGADEAERITRDLIERLDKIPGPPDLTLPEDAHL